MTFFIILAVFVLGFIGLYIYNKYIQKQHAVLRAHPILGSVRYFLEKMGPKLRQYLFEGMLEGRPFPRYIYEQVVLLGKYTDNPVGFGSQKDFDKPGWFITHSFLGTQAKRLHVDNKNPLKTWIYKIKKDSLVWRSEERVEKTIDQYLLSNEHAIVLGTNDPLVKQTYTVKSIINMSAMSFGSLGPHAVQTLAHGLEMTHAWVNTGEGGTAPYHFVGGGSVIYQFGPAMFGCRNEDGTFNAEKYAERVSHKQVIATEIKFHQGAKVKGGHLPKEKITEEISNIRGIPMGIDCISPATYPHIETEDDLCDFIIELKTLSGKPVGLKIAMGEEKSFDRMFAKLKERDALPNYIAIDGSEGGTGAAPQDMADSLSLPIFNGLVILRAILEKHGLFKQIPIFASGKLVTADQIVIALSLGASGVNIARGLMMQLGCIQALECHKNTCPVGVATQDADAQDYLVIEEKKFRVANYVATLRKNIYAEVVACGKKSPLEFTLANICYKNANGIVISGEKWYEMQTKGLLYSKQENEVLDTVLQ